MVSSKTQLREIRCHDGKDEKWSSARFRENVAEDRHKIWWQRGAMYFDHTLNREFALVYDFSA